MAVHKNLTGADLHEPKGADTALSGQVYVANGSGSGVWTDATSVITNTAWSTGDVKLTLKTTADSTWVMMDDGTIGDGSSGASTRANADTQALFYLLWNNISDTYAPVTGGRGASAAADYAAHKKIALTKVLGRALAVAGAGSGLTSRALGYTVGEETHVLTVAELASHTHTNSLTDPGHTHTYSRSTIGGQAGNSAGWWGMDNSYYSTQNTSSTITGISITNASAGSSSAHNNMQPTSFFNVMIKL